MNIVRNVLVIVGMGIATWVVCWCSRRKDKKSGGGDGESGHED